ncbi:MAG: Unknown protein [uncultured Sulfurovum sp.]|uniref:Response regulatory domain-containing protein n=1 Tax=uncultured Sulfurovum sp. TaxID=269237 RepID=A0A6S6RY46_9BACT|nr:MAG: Unknown protein [uncultured Sulfurovum sp.]
MSDKRIYIVDDYPLAALITKKTIEKLSINNCIVSEFESSLLLLNRFQKEFEQIDMIITDYEMPDLRGDELIKEVRKMKPNIKIVVMSAWLDTSVLEGQELIGKEVKALRPDLILAKPFPDGWVGKVDKILEERG